MFVFVHIPPICSVLLTYSLEIDSLLFWPTLYDDDVNDETTAVDNRRYYGANAHCGDRLSLSAN